MSVLIFPSSICDLCDRAHTLYFLEDRIEHYIAQRKYVYVCPFLDRQAFFQSLIAGEWLDTAPKAAIEMTRVES